MDIKKITINDTFVDRLVEVDEVVTGDLIVFTEDIYSTNFFTATIIGKRHILARIIKQSYGRNYITFSMEVIECIGDNSSEIIDKGEIRRRENSIFGKYKVYRQLWNNELDRCYLLDGQYRFKYCLNQEIS